MVRLLVPLLLASGCVDHPIDVPDEPALRVVDDPHALVACTSAWPIADARCEAACDPRPVMTSAPCMGAHPNGSGLACAASFQIVDGDGAILTGCCALFGDWTTPTFVEFAVCPT